MLLVGGTATIAGFISGTRAILAAAPIQVTDLSAIPGHNAFVSPLLIPGDPFIPTP